jgi:fatty acid desaturase
MYFPILFVARVNWFYQSLMHALDKDVDWCANQEYPFYPLENQAMELGTLGIHYAINIAVMYKSGFSLPFALFWWFWAQGSCGLMLALVFGLGHNGMSVYEAEKKPEWYKHQITTTRNITGNVLVHWFCGGLSYQVEHHMFPMVPRHNLPKVKEEVQALCKKHNIPYHETDMWTGTKEVLSCLSEITQELLHEFPAL